MKRALLVGNGFTSQLIPAYKDINMMTRLRATRNTLYEKLNSLLSPFRELPEKDDLSIIRLLSQYKVDNPEEQYRKFFVEYNLSDELYQPEILSVESLLKVASLFKDSFEECVENEIIKIANQIYFNEGENGILSINEKVTRDKLKKFINSFEFVFTTNFDNVLDDAFDGEVAHLHGGFFYKREVLGTSTFITKTTEVQEHPCLVWGINYDRKLAASKGGTAFPISFPLVLGSSILEEHLKQLQRASIGELYIWGYSGQNDAHINCAIDRNTNIQKIVYYTNPHRVGDISEIERLQSRFSPSNRSRLVVLSWEDVWKEVQT